MVAYCIHDVVWCQELIGHTADWLSFLMHVAVFGRYLEDVIIIPWLPFFDLGMS